MIRLPAGNDVEALAGKGASGVAEQGGASARCPRAELLGVAYCPNAFDPVVRDLECVHRHGHSVQLAHQPGLTVHGALQERQVGGLAGDTDVGASDLLAAFDRTEVRRDEAAAVGDRCGIGVEETDESRDVLCLPCLLELFDDVSLLGWGSPEPATGECDGGPSWQAGGMPP